jgi:hypothetical protein
MFFSLKIQNFQFKLNFKRKSLNSLKSPRTQNQAQKIFKCPHAIFSLHFSDSLAEYEFVMICKEQFKIEKWKLVEVDLRYGEKRKMAQS